MKTLANYIEETIRRYGAVGSNRGMGFTLEEAFKQGDKVTVYNKPATVVGMDADSVYVQFDGVNGSTAVLANQVKPAVAAAPVGPYKRGDQVIWNGKPYTYVRPLDANQSYVTSANGVDDIAPNTAIKPAVAEAAPGDPETNADNTDPLLAKSVDLAPVKALEESAELKLILQRAKLVE